jgi:antitoxin VapB
VEKKTTAKLFRNGRSQAVRLPKEFRFEGDMVRIRRMGKGVLLEPMIIDPRGWFEALDCLKVDDSFFAGVRRQPKAPRRKIF